MSHCRATAQRAAEHRVSVPTSGASFPVGAFLASPECSRRSKEVPPGCAGVCNRRRTASLVWMADSRGGAYTILDKAASKC
eukprot:366088-Chlamydomonas_euryale.AAC.18